MGKEQDIIDFVKAAMDVSLQLTSVDTIHDQSMTSAQIRKNARRDALLKFHRANSKMGDIVEALKEVKNEISL